jgi:TfoX/Sxy family transcriptional regulator of competence genes
VRLPSRHPTVLFARRQARLVSKGNAGSIAPGWTVATDQSFVEYIQSQSGLGHRLSFKKMFGEYALYLHGKVVAFACDNQLYLKPTEEARALLGSVSEHPPYPGAKLYFRMDEQLEDRELLLRALETTARALPLPKPKAAARRGAKATRQRP